MNLPDFVDRYHGALFSDFHHYYNRDIDEWIDDGLTVKQMRDLIEGLPPDSALGRAQDRKGWFWNYEVELLAILCELVDRLCRDVENALGGSNPRPLRIPRPWSGSAGQKNGVMLDDLLKTMKKE